MRTAALRLSLAMASLAAAAEAQRGEELPVRIKPSSPYEDGCPDFLSVREPKNNTAPRSPRKSFRKSSKR